MELRILPMNEDVKQMYESHGTFHEGDSGLDLFCPRDITVEPGQTVFVDLEIRCEALVDGCNVSYYMYPRSSLSKTDLRFANSVGIIDAGYRGNLRGAFDNIRDEPYVIQKGQRLLQICSPTLGPIKMTLVNTLSETSRGEGGFGSTGV